MIDYFANMIFFICVNHSCDIIDSENVCIFVQELETI